MIVFFSSSSNCSSRIFQRRTCSSRILQKRICFCSSSSSARSSGSMYISLRICWSILGISLLRFRNCNSWPPQVSLSTENGKVQYIQCERKRSRLVVEGRLKKIFQITFRGMFIATFYNLFMSFSYDAIFLLCWCSIYVTGRRLPWFQLLNFRNPT